MFLRCLPKKSSSKAFAEIQRSKVSSHIPMIRGNLPHTPSTPKKWTGIALEWGNGLPSPNIFHQLQLMKAVVRGGLGNRANWYTDQTRGSVWQEACVTMHDEPCIQRNDITIYRCVGRMLIQHISINYYIAGNLHPQYINIAARLYSWTLDYMVIAIATDPWLSRSLLNGLGKETMATNYSIFSQTRMVMLLPSKQHS